VSIRSKYEAGWAPWEALLFGKDENLSKRDLAVSLVASGRATDVPALFVCLFRENVELKKVNSKYILKSTLTPQLSRKKLESSSSSMERCQSMPTVVPTDSNSETKFCLGPVSAQSAETVWGRVWLTECFLFRQSTLYR
jgi:hypothetical protein